MVVVRFNPKYKPTKTPLCMIGKSTVLETYYVMTLLQVGGPEQIAIFLLVERCASLYRRGNIPSQYLSITHGVLTERPGYRETVSVRR